VSILIIIHRNKKVVFLISFLIVQCKIYIFDGLWLMVFNTTFNNISAISWQSVLLVEESRVPRENHLPARPLWLWSYGSWIYNYLWNQCLSPLMLWIRTPLRLGVLDTTLCDKVCQWLVAGRWFSLGTLDSSTNKTDCHDIAEILLKVVLNTSTINKLTLLFSLYSDTCPNQTLSKMECCINRTLNKVTM
jgi:hypothetical protein